MRNRFVRPNHSIRIIAILAFFLLACSLGSVPVTQTPTSPPPTFTATTAPSPTPTPLPAMSFFFVDAFEPHYAKIYKLANGQVSLHFERVRGGQIYSFAYAPDGTLYLADANSYNLAKIVDGKEIRFFQHATYIRFLAFDSKGNLYFSESTGAGGDAKIYRLEGTTATLYYEIKLSEVDGFCCGGFTFDQNDDLWFSSGNIRGASLFKVENGVPVKKLTFDDESMYGFYFDADGNLIVANWDKNVYRYIAPDFINHETFIVPEAVHLSDIKPITP